jgi:hypothetical protein
MQSLIARREEEREEGREVEDVEDDVDGEEVDAIGGSGGFMIVGANSAIVWVIFGRRHRKCFKKKNKFKNGNILLNTTFTKSVFLQF